MDLHFVHNNSIYNENRAFDKSDLRPKTHGLELIHVRSMFPKISRIEKKNQVI